jgi:hypothetical protein
MAARSTAVAKITKTTPWRHYAPRIWEMDAEAARAGRDGRGRLPGINFRARRFPRSSHCQHHLRMMSSREATVGFAAEERLE